MNKRGFSTSLIISTYNWPQALNLCLLSVKNQIVLPDEVIIADDGSGEETRALIEKFQLVFPVPLKHVWHPDEGFQLSRIRNRAIAAATKDYIIQIDGDLILHPKFISDHMDFCQVNTFTTGSRVIMNEELSAKLLENQNINVNILSRGLSNISNGIRLKTLSRYLADRYRIDDIYYMRGCNMAFWRRDLIKVNGYNEEFIGWGREDNELAVRLINAGVKKRSFKFSGIVFHIYHPENSRANCSGNENLLAKAIEKNIVYSKLGMSQYLQPVPITEE